MRIGNKLVIECIVEMLNYLKRCRSENCVFRFIILYDIMVNYNFEGVFFIVDFCSFIYCKYLGI